ncbi:putative NAC domain-containing protein 94 [Mangifera indica]|uniref:putative NAC domain-containing protein 94 n=1 Tax=Mangifera indica TaxID=29780 RepID=UPI001CFBF88B|nr:putative NAC domain-containing protein 94 [Mangifera indica]
MSNINVQLLGYRFKPTDEEIISYYLEKKMARFHFPHNVVNEVEICNFEPWELPKLSALSDDEEWYFFSKPCKYGNGKGIKRKTPAGHWKVTCSDRCVWDDSEENEIGKKTTLVFYKGRGSKAVKTDWMIHEYHSNRAYSYQNAFVFCRLTGQLDDDGSNSHS